MRQVIDISWQLLALGYLLMLVPLCVIFLYRLRIMSSLLISMLRMTIQLLFVGFYLHFVFDLDYWWLNVAWMLVMVLVADLSIVNRCRLRLVPFMPRLFIALFAGISVPLLFFLGWIIDVSNPLSAAYFIPLAGMIMGNCLRANVIGINHFYTAVREKQKTFRHELARGASLSEALSPHLRTAVEAALSPSIATMATIGIVALPGMMTGIILGGNDPMTAIKYQIAIMIAIFTGTAITVVLGILMTRGKAFSGWGILKRELFK
jgi:putative ABC transport system permease protein